MSTLDIQNTESALVGNISPQKTAEMYHKIGWEKAQVGDIAGEIEYWTKAIELIPQFSAVYADRAMGRVALNDYKGAMEDAEMALKLNPELESQLRPLLNRLSTENELISKGNSDMNKNSTSKEKEIDLENGRREFIKNVSLMGAATMIVSLAGCGSHKLAGGQKGVKWGMVIDLNRCAGCRACTVACKSENHTPPGVAYNIVIEKESGTYPYYKRTFLPRPCMQCENSSCSKVCPVSATYHREDGIVVVDYDKCIGCKYCIAACPYGARSFDYGHNYSKGLSNPWEQQPSPEYGQHRKRENHVSPIGNVRKCTFCLHRVTNGIAPACSSTCMGNAIHFGNLADPDAKCMAHGENLQQLLATRNYMRLKEEIGNEPRVFYLT